MGVQGSGGYLEGEEIYYIVIELQWRDWDRGIKCPGRGKSGLWEGIVEEQVTLEGSLERHYYRRFLKFIHTVAK